MYEKLSKKARTCMFVNECIGAVILTIVLVVIWYALRRAEVPFSVNLIWIIVAVVWIFSIIVPIVRYERYRYRFSEEDIDVREGFLFVKRDIVPIERLHKVSLANGPIDRAFGLSKVIVTTAGGDVTIRFIETQLAEKIVERLKVRINTYAVQDRSKVMGQSSNMVTGTKADLVASQEEHTEE